MERSLRRFDVILVDFGFDIIGSEQGGIRPAIIIQNDIGNIYSSTTIVMPLSTKIKNLNQPTHTLIEKGKEKGLVENSMVLGEAMRQISEKWIIKYLGCISEEIEKDEIKRVYFANFGEVA